MSSCPRCLEHRLLAPDGEYDARACASCRGAWLPTAAARRVLAGAFGPLDALPTVKAGFGALRCPDCAVELVRRRVAGVEIDVCAAHGVWFDHREVERVRAAALQPHGAGLAVGAVAVAAATLAESPLSQRATASNADMGAVLDVTMITADVASSSLDVAAAAGDGVLGALDVVDVGEIAGVGVEAASGAFDALAHLFEGLFSVL